MEGFSLSPQQKHIWTLRKKGLASGIKMCLEICGPLDQEILREALVAVQDRHEILRTFFHLDGSRSFPIQVVNEEARVGYSFFDARSLDDAAQARKIDEVYGAGFSDPLDGGQDAVRYELLQQSEHRHVLVIHASALVLDGASMVTLVNEIGAVYGHKADRLAWEAADIIQYAQYSDWKNEGLAGIDREERKSLQLNGYQQHLNVHLPFGAEAPPAPAPGSAYASVGLGLTGELLGACHAFARENDKTLFEILLTCWQILLFRLTGQADLVVGISSADKEYEVLQEALGTFAETLPLHTPVDAGNSFRQQLEAVAKTCGELTEWKEYFSAQAGQAGHDTGETLFYIPFGFGFSEQEVPRALGSACTIKVLKSALDAEVFELKLHAVQSGESLKVDFHYNPSVLGAPDAVRTANCYRVLLQSLLAQPDAALGGCPLLDAAEREQVLRGFNQTDLPVAQTTLVELFEATAGQHPHQPAVFFADHQLSFGQLNQQANQLAHYLRNTCRVAPQEVVALALERSHWLIVGLLGILKAGAAYLPLDPTHPQERNGRILTESRTRLLLTGPGLPPAAPAAVTALDLEQVLAQDLPAGNLPRVNQPHHPAYVIYTSGSTGTPKGVVVAHQAVVNLCAGLQERVFRHQAVTRALLAPAVFDASVQQIFPGLLTGSSLVIIDEQTRKDTRLLYPVLRARRVEAIDCTPALLSLWLDQDAEGFAQLGLHYVLVGGDTWSAALLEQCNRLDRRQTRLVNVYGPTECCVDATACELPARGRLTRAPIGKPLPNYRLYILDAYQQPVPAGVSGEVYIGGSGVALGYLHNPALTAEKFVHLPAIEAGRLYRTGDQARWLAGGEVEFLGRLDEQAKLNGYRIETGEVEYHLGRHPAVRQAVVLLKAHADQRKYLAAYLTTERAVTSQELTDYLRQQLPPYMIPAHFRVLPSMPLTPNGKLDRKALPDWQADEAPAAAAYVAPGNPVEAALIAVLEKTLGRSPISVTDNFFVIGGDSVKAIQISARLYKLGYRIEVRDVFQNPVIADLARCVKRTDHVTDQVAVTGTVPLTPIQRAFFASPHVKQNHYNQAALLHLTGACPPAAVSAVFTRLLAHHDALRMVFRKEAGSVVQTNLGLDSPLSLQVFDLKEESEPLNALQDKVNQVQASLDIATGPLLKLALFQLPDGDRLLIVIHHLVVDGVSWRILFEDIDGLFRQYAEGKTLELPLKSDAFKTWSEKLTAYAASDALLREKAYWEAVGRVKVQPLRKDFPAEDRSLSDVDFATFSLSSHETEMLLTRVNEAFGTEINDILLTALGVSCWKYFGLENVLISLEGHGREEVLKGVNISRTVGWFTSLYPVVVSNRHVNNLLRQIKETKEYLRGVPSKGIGYGILKYLSGESDATGGAFALQPEISFNYLGQFDTDVNQASFRIAQEPAGDNQSRDTQREHVLDVSGMIADGKLTLSVLYNKSQFKAETIRRFQEVHQATLRAVIQFCVTQKKKHLTPSDLTYKGLSIDQVDELSGRYPVADVYPLTPMQEGLLFHAIHNPSSPLYFEQLSYRLRGAMDPALTESTLNELVKRHDVLRTLFIYQGVSRMLQVVLTDRQTEFYYEDISWLGDAREKATYLDRYKDQDLKRSFDLTRDHLMRVALFRLDADEYEFVWSQHHIIMDGWCMGQLVAEFYEIYNSGLENQPYRLPQPKPYKNYVKWLETTFNKENAKQYWLAYLQDYQKLTGVPRKHAAPAAKREYKQEQVNCVIDRDRTAAVRQLMEQQQVTLNTIYQTVWAILLAKYNNTRDVVFGAVVSGRPAEVEGIESMIGLFINTIPVRIGYTAQTRFSDLLGLVQKAALDSEPYHYYSLADIQSESRLSQNLMDHILVFRNFPVDQQIEEAADTPAKRFALSQIQGFEQSNYDFEVSLYTGEDTQIDFRFNGHVYDPAFVERLARHFTHVLEQVLADATRNVNGLSLVDAGEREQLLSQSGHPAVADPAGNTVVDLFEAQVQKTPQALAVTFEGQSLTYRQLDERSNQLAHYLKSKGVGPETLVPICLERSLDMMVGILGILKAGGAYVPLDPAYPEGRIAYLLSDAGANLAVTTGAYAGRLGPAPGLDRVLLDADWERIAGESREQPADRAQPGHLAYVIYTSGSTGNPKGVLVEHRGLAASTAARCAYYPGVRSAFLVPSFAFDSSVAVIFGTLLSGGTLILYPAGQIKDAAYVRRALQESAVILCVPSYYDFLLAEGLVNGSALKTVILAGEKLEEKLAARHYAQLPDTQLYNEYGPTEATVWATVAAIPAGAPVVTIGKPVTGVRVYVADPSGQPTPLGVPGELWVGGVQVARGYLNQEELTRQKFIANPFGEGRLYKTGDLVRWLPDGTLEYLGRKDEQVKLNGYRIELGEVEYHLGRHPAVRQAVVLLQGADEDKYLAAYLTTERAVTSQELTKYLRQHLPQYMIPAHFRVLPSMPLTPNGKLDRKALPDWQADEAPAAAAGAAPGNPVEDTLTAIWREVLGKESIGTQENFFALGGNSIKIVKMFNLVNHHFPGALTISDLFDNPGIGLQAKLISEKTNGTVEEELSFSLLKL